jgi:hypothetical protein
MSTAGGGFGPWRARRRARRDLLAEAALALVALPLAGAREAGAQVYYDQFGQPVTLPPGTAVIPGAPAPAAAPAPGYGYPGPAGAVSQTRQVARRTARRTGRREGVREDAWDAID